MINEINKIIDLEIELLKEKSQECNREINSKICYAIEVLEKLKEQFKEVENE